MQHRTCQKTEEAYHAGGRVRLLFHLAHSNQISFYQVDSLGKITDGLIHPLEFRSFCLWYPIWALFTSSKKL